MQLRILRKRTRFEWPGRSVGEVESRDIVSEVLQYYVPYKPNSNGDDLCFVNEWVDIPIVEELEVIKQNAKA